MLVGSATISAARRAASSWKMAAHGRVARWKKRCRSGVMAGWPGAITSAASWATSGYENPVPPAFEFR
jgi:hypothetical protein